MLRGCDYAQGIHRSGRCFQIFLLNSTNFFVVPFDTYPSILNGWKGVSFHLLLS